MRLFEEVEMLDRMFELIQKRQSGCPDSFRRRLGISRSKLYTLLAELKDNGIDIKYDKQIKSFYLVDDIRVKIEKPIRVIANEDLLSVGGGYISSVHFFGQKPIYI